MTISFASFASFARDAYTSLPELVDRPLTIHLDAWWRYADLRDGVGEGLGLLGPRAVRDEIERTFHEFNSRSIQHLVHEIGGGGSGAGSDAFKAAPQFVDSFGKSEAIFEARNFDGDRIELLVDPLPERDSVA